MFVVILEQSLHAYITRFFHCHCVHCFNPSLASLPLMSGTCPLSGHDDVAKVKDTDCRRQYDISLGDDVSCVASGDCTGHPSDLLRSLALTGQKVKQVKVALCGPTCGEGYSSRTVHE